MSNDALTTGLMFSENVDSILPKLLEAKQAMAGAGVRKNATNTHLGNSYANINAVVEMLDPVLNEVGLLSMTATRVDSEARIVTVDTTILHAETGQWVRRSSSFEVSNLAAQVVAGCETYARRYNHNGLFNLRAEDDDGNTATQAAPQGGSRPPSGKALAFAETMAAEHGIEVPDEVRTDAKVCSKFIDELKGTSNRSPASSNQEQSSDAFEKAKAHIEKVAKGELDAIRIQVQEHKVLSALEKTSLKKLIDKRLTG